MAHATIGLFLSSTVCCLRHQLTHRSTGLIYRTGYSFTSNLNSTRDIIPATENTSDILLQTIKSSVNVTNVLQVVHKHHSVMNTGHTLQALASIFQLHKSGCCSASKQEIMNTPEFAKLCRKLKSQARTFNINETVDALKIISYMGVHSSSIIVQTLLQLIRHQVNDLSLQQIVFLEFVLKRMKSSSLTDALRIALPLVFEAQLETKIDRSNPSQLAELLYYSVQTRCSDSCIEVLLGALNDLHHELDINSAKNVVLSVCLMKYPNISCDKILHAALNTLANNIGQLQYEEIEFILFRMVEKYSQKNLFLYHEHFLNCCAKYVISQDSGFDKGVWILRKMTGFGHVSIDLLDYLCERVVENVTLLENCRPATLISVISALAIANYKPENWGCIKDSILKNPLLQDEKLELPWIKISVNLALLDCFFNPLLERVFQEDFLKKFLDRKYNLLDHLQLLTLYHAVFTLHPTYSGPLPPSAIMQEAMSKNGEHVKDFPLKGALERGLGGSCYLLTKVHTKLGQFVDHVVVMRKGGYPVAINEGSEQSTSSRQFVEDLIIPPNSQVVMIMCHLPNCYTNNCHRLRGHFVLVGKTLEALGYVVVHISLELWEKLLDHEKIPYLMQNIKLSSDSQNSSEIYA